MTDEKAENLGASSIDESIRPQGSTVQVKARCSDCGYIDNEPLPANKTVEVRKCYKCLEEVEFENIIDG